MIVIPTLAGFALARSFRGALLIAMAFALVAVGAGLVLAYYLGLAAGASVVLTALGLFAFTGPLRRLRTALAPAAVVLAVLALVLVAVTGVAPPPTRCAWWRPSPISKRSRSGRG